MPQTDWVSNKTNVACFKLLYQLYTNGPIRLVSDKGHCDFVSTTIQMCCSREPFLDAMSLIKTRGLVQEGKNERGQPIFSLTDKGLLAVTLIHYRGRATKLNHCPKFGEAFDSLLRQLHTHGRLELVVNSDTGHVHIKIGDVRLCSRRAPLLDAICHLEHCGLIEAIEEFNFQLTKKGSLAAVLLSVSQERCLH